MERLGDGTRPARDHRLERPAPVQNVLTIGVILNCHEVTHCFNMFSVQMPLRSVRKSDGQLHDNFMLLGWPGSSAKGTQSTSIQSEVTCSMQIRSGPLALGLDLPAAW